MKETGSGGTAEVREYKTLFTESDYSGEDIFYADEERKVPFNGVVEDYDGGQLRWKFDVRDGFRTGKEWVYYETGELMEENETDHNTICGFAAEFYRNGVLKSAGTAIRNVFIESVFFDVSGEEISRETEKGKSPSCPFTAEEIEEYRKKYRLDDFIESIRKRS